MANHRLMLWYIYTRYTENKLHNSCSSILFLLYIESHTSISFKNSINFRYSYNILNLEQWNRQYWCLNNISLSVSRHLYEYITYSYDIAASIVIILSMLTLDSVGITYILVYPHSYKYVFYFWLILVPYSIIAQCQTIII